MIWRCCFISALPSSSVQWSCFRRAHLRLFPEDGIVVVAILNAKTSKGLQSLFFCTSQLWCQFFNVRERSSSYLYSSSPALVRRKFAFLVKAVGLPPSADYVPYCLRTCAATTFYQRFGLGRTVMQGRHDARATLLQFFCPPASPPCSSTWLLFGEWLCQVTSPKLAIGRVGAPCRWADVHY